MARAEKVEYHPDTYLPCAGCGRQLRVGDSSMPYNPPPDTPPEKIHKTIDREQPWYRLMCADCGHWTIKAPL